MKKFMVIYHAPIDAIQQMGNVSPEEMKKGMEPWMVIVFNGNAGCLFLSLNN